MESNAHAFLRFALDCEVLRFGEFTLKSGRVSPYFFNAGLFNTGARLARLGGFYARALAEAGVPFDTLFGPAYKGIPLAAACAIALAREHDRDLPWCFNRKEAKDHGEGGRIVGAPLAGRVMIVDDVITAGTAVGESMALIAAAGARPAGVVIALDRQEKGQGDLSAVDEVRRRHGVPVIAIATMADLLAFLEAEPRWAVHLPALRAYRERYGT